MKECPNCGEPLEQPNTDDVRAAEQEFLRAAGSPFTAAEQQTRDETVERLRKRFVLLRDWEGHGKDSCKEIT